MVNNALRGAGDDGCPFFQAPLLAPLILDLPQRHKGREVLYDARETPDCLRYLFNVLLCRHKKKGTRRKPGSAKAENKREKETGGGVRGARGFHHRVPALEEKRRQFFLHGVGGANPAFLRIWRISACD